MIEQIAFEIQKTSGLTNADWAEINKLEKMVGASIARTCTSCLSKNVATNGVDPSAPVASASASSAQARFMSSTAWTRSMVSSGSYVTWSRTSFLAPSPLD